MAIRFSSPHPLTDKEEAEIQKMIASDPDNPEITDEQLKQGKSFADAFPDLAESIQRSRGGPSVDSPKQQVSLRLSPDVLAKLKASGKDWQLRADDSLREAVGL